jgi:hypothetical protein
MSSFLSTVKRRDILRADRRIDLRALGHRFLCNQDSIDRGMIYLEGKALQNSEDVASSPIRFCEQERRYGCHGQGFHLTRLILA